MDLQVDGANAQQAYAVSSNFHGFVWRTQNGGQSWTDMTGNLPNVPAWSLQINPIAGGFTWG